MLFNKQNDATGNHELLCPLPFQASLGDFQGRESSQRAENRALWQDLKQAICGRSSGATGRTHQIRINEMIDGDGGFMKESLNLVRRPLHSYGLNSFWVADLKSRCPYGNWMIVVLFEDSPGISNKIQFQL